MLDKEQIRNIRENLFEYDYIWPDGRMYYMGRNIPSFTPSNFLFLTELVHYLLNNINLDTLKEIDNDS